MKLTQQDYCTMREVITLLLDLEFADLDVIMEEFKLQKNQGFELLELFGYIISDKVYKTHENKFRKMVELPEKEVYEGWYHINPIIKDQFTNFSSGMEILGTDKRGWTHFIFHGVDDYRNLSKLWFAHQFTTTMLSPFYVIEDKKEALNSILKEPITRIYEIIIANILHETVARSKILHKLKDKKDLDKIIRKNCELVFSNIPKQYQYRHLIPKVIEFFQSFELKELQEFKSMEMMDEDMGNWLKEMERYDKQV